MNKNKNLQEFNRRTLLKSSIYGLSGLILTNKLSTLALAQEAQQTGLSLNNHHLISSMYDLMPATASNTSGKAWIVALRHLKDSSQQIVMSDFDGKWSTFKPITNKPGSYETPKIACAQNGTPMLVWSQEENGNWTIQSYQISNGIQTCAVDGHARPINPTITAANKDEYWLAWESFEKGKFKICLKQFCKGKWSKVIDITDGKLNSYNPAITFGPDKKIWLAYSQAYGPHRSIKLTHYDIKKSMVGKIIDVAVGGNFEDMPNINSYPDICFDKDGVLWITWETRGSIKGKDRKDTPCFFGARHCPVVCYKDGKIQQIADKNYELFKGSNDQLPIFIKDTDDRLWLFTRAVRPEHKKNGSDRTWIWNTRASRLESDGWTEPINIFNGVPSGRGERPAVAISDKGKFWLVWQNDNWPIHVHELRTNKIQTDSYISELYLAELSLPPAEKLKPSFKLTPAQIIRQHDPNIGRPWVERRKVKTNGNEYTLLFGNLHEHTDMSRCWPAGSDGDFDENYRYGMDVEGYDFVALTDHGYDFDMHRWSRNRRAARFYNSPPYFISIPAFEWTLSCAIMGKMDHLVPGSGHRNLIFASDKEASKFLDEKGIFYHCFNSESNRIDKVWDVLKQKGIRAVTIPHHPADWHHPVCWKYNNQDYQMVVEIFQTRQSSEHKGCPRETKHLTKFEGCYVQDALAKGHKLGFIASGDHNHMGEGLAAVFVKEVSQEGIYEALKSRRCYATTGDKIFMDFRIDGHFMGKEINAEKNPTIYAKIEAVEPLTNIVVFKNNKVIYELNEEKLKNKKQYKINFTDKDFTEDSYYYIRAIQQNDEIGWVSPIWVKKA